MMIKVAGVKIDRTRSGIPTYAHINLKKYSCFIPVLEELEIRVEQEKTTGVSQCPRGYLTKEEFREQGLSVVNELCDKYGIL